MLNMSIEDYKAAERARERQMTAAHRIRKDAMAHLGYTKPYEKLKPNQQDRVDAECRRMAKDILGED